MAASKMRHRSGGPQRRFLKTRCHRGGYWDINKGAVGEGVMLMGDVAGGDIARRRWMEMDAVRKQ